MCCVEKISYYNFSLILRRLNICEAHEILECNNDDTDFMEKIIIEMRPESIVTIHETKTHSSK